MSDDNKLLDVKGYKLRPGLVRNSAGDYVSPLTSAETIYDGDKNLSDILEDIEKEKKSFPEVVIKNVHINPDQWIPYGDYFCFNYADPLLPVDRVSEVRCNDKNMKKIVDDMIRWIISEDTAPNSIAIYAQKRPTKELDLKLVIYTKYLKIPLDINKTDWKNSKSMKRYKVEDERINYDKLGLFHLDKDNISLFLNNNFSVVITNEKYAYIYTDKAIKINATLVLIDKHIEYTNDIFEEDGIYNVNWYVDGIIIKKEKVKEGEDATPPANVELDDYQTFLDIKPMYYSNGTDNTHFHTIFTINNNNRLCYWNRSSVSDKLEMIDISNYIGPVTKMEYTTDGILCINVQKNAYYIGWGEEVGCIDDEKICIGQMYVCKLLENVDGIDRKVLYANNSAYIVLDSSDLNTRCIDKNLFSEVIPCLYKFNLQNITRVFASGSAVIDTMFIVMNGSLYVLGATSEYLCGVKTDVYYNNKYISTQPSKINIPFNANDIKIIDFKTKASEKKYDVTYIILNNGDLYACGNYQNSNTVTSFVKTKFNNVLFIETNDEYELSGSNDITLMLTSEYLVTLAQSNQILNKTAVKSNNLIKVYGRSDGTYIGLNNKGEIIINGLAYPFYNYYISDRVLKIPNIYQRWMPDYHSVQCDLDIGLTGNSFKKSDTIQSLSSIYPSTNTNTDYDNAKSQAYEPIMVTDNKVFVYDKKLRKTISYSLKDGNISNDEYNLSIPDNFSIKNQRYSRTEIKRMSNTEYAVLFIKDGGEACRILYNDDDITTNIASINIDYSYKIEYMSDDEIYIIGYGTNSKWGLFKCDMSGNYVIIDEFPSVSFQKNYVLGNMDNEFIYAKLDNKKVLIRNKDNNVLSESDYSMYKSIQLFRIVHCKNTYLFIKADDKLIIKDIKTNIDKVIDFNLSSIGFNDDVMSIYTTNNEICITSFNGTFSFNVDTNAVSYNNNHINIYDCVLTKHTEFEKLVILADFNILTLKNLEYGKNELIKTYSNNGYEDCRLIYDFKNNCSKYAYDQQSNDNNIISSIKFKNDNDVNILSAYGFSPSHEAKFVLENIKNCNSENIELVKTIIMNNACPNPDMSVKSHEKLSNNVMFNINGDIRIYGNVVLNGNTEKVNPTTVKTSNNLIKSENYINSIINGDYIYLLKYENLGCSTFNEGYEKVVYNMVISKIDINTASETELYRKERYSYTYYPSSAKDEIVKVERVHSDTYRILHDGSIYAEIENGNKVTFHYGSSYSMIKTLEDIIGETKFKNISMYEICGCIDYEGKIIVVLSNGLQFDENMNIVMVYIDPVSLNLIKYVDNIYTAPPLRYNTKINNYACCNKNILIDKYMMVFTYQNIVFAYDLKNECFVFATLLKFTSNPFIYDFKFIPSDSHANGLKIIIKNDDNEYSSYYDNSSIGNVYMVSTSF